MVFLVLGLGTGATYAGLGMGLVVAYRGSGVINFAHGAFAMYTTLFFVELREKGDLVFPWAGVPARVHVLDDPSTPVAFVAAVILGALIGLAAYGLVFRPLRHSPPLARVVASVGVMLTLQALAVLRFGTGTKTSKPLFPNDAVEIFGTRVPRERFFLAATVLIIAAILWVLYHKTLFGLTTQAAATNERVAALLGYSSDRVAALNWVIAAVIAAVTGILISPITSVNATNFTLFVVPALAAALVGRLMSFWHTAIAGLTLGMLQSVVILVQRESWFPRLGTVGPARGTPVPRHHRRLVLARRPPPDPR